MAERIDYATEHALGLHAEPRPEPAYRPAWWVDCEECVRAQLAAKGPLSVRERRQWINADLAMIRLFAYYGHELTQYMRPEMRGRVRRNA